MVVIMDSAPAATLQHPPLAGLGRRALVYGKEVGACIAAFALLFIAGAAVSYFAFSDPDANLAFFAAFLPSIWALFGLWLLGYTVLQWRGGTPFMRSGGIRLVRASDGAPLGFWSVVLRNVVWALGASIIVGYFSPLFDGSGRRRGWHDKAAGAFVVEVVREPVAAAQLLPPGDFQFFGEDDGTSEQLPRPSMAAKPKSATQHGVNHAIPLNDQIWYQWRSFFLAGNTYRPPIDTDGVRRRVRTNTVFLVLLWTLVILAIVVGILIYLNNAGRILTYVLLGLLVVVALFAIDKFTALGRRLRQVRAIGDRYFEVSAKGVGVAGEFFLPWEYIAAGAGVDARNNPMSASHQRIAPLALRAGDLLAGVVIGFQPGDAVRKQFPKHLRYLLFTLPEGGVVGFPLDNVLPPEQVATALAAFHIAATEAGVPFALVDDPKVLGSVRMPLMQGKPLPAHLLRQRS